MIRSLLTRPRARAGRALTVLALLATPASATDELFDALDFRHIGPVGDRGRAR